MSKGDIAILFHLFVSVCRNTYEHKYGISIHGLLVAIYKCESRAGSNGVSTMSSSRILVVDDDSVIRELLEIIKDDPVTENTPVILLTAKNSCKDKMTGKEILRTNEFFTRPFDFNELICAVRRLC